MTQIMVSTVVFKSVNLFALLGYLLNVIGMFNPDHCNEVSDIINGIFHLLSLLALFAIEVDQKPIFAKYVPFLFSFVGRGLLYIWLAWTTFRISILSGIGSIITCIVGVIYVLLFILKNLNAPSTLQFEETYTETPGAYFSENESFLQTSCTTGGAQNQDEESR